MHAGNRGDLRPDPEVDNIEAICYSIFNDVPPDKGTRHETGVFIVDAESAGQSQDGISSASPSSAKKAKVDKPIAGTSKDVRSQKMGLTLLQKSGVGGVKVIYVKDENELLHRFIGFIHR